MSDLEFKIRWVNGDPAFRSPQDLEAAYACPEHAAPQYYPNGWVSRVYFWETGTLAQCSGDDCPSGVVGHGDDARGARCDFQNELQETIDPISMQIESMLALLMWNVYGMNNRRLWATIVTFPIFFGEDCIVWRFPAVEASTGTDIVSLVQQALSSPQSAPLVQQYGVRIICDFGNLCVADSDGDGICDVDDCCPDDFSPLANCQDEDNDGVPACSDNCPKTPNADWFDMQFDFDQDGVGNACDEDIDGDGVINDYDADAYLAGMRWDLDQDGYAEHWHMPGTQDHLDCNASCMWIKSFLTNHYGYIPPNWARFAWFDCNELCLESWDNCADGLGQSASTDFTQFDSPACQEVYGILSQGRGPNNASEVAAFDGCRDLYFNADQDPANPVGRRCQTGVQELEFAPIDDTGCGSPDTYRVAFTANAASVDPAGELFMGTSVESCACETNWTPGAVDIGLMGENYGVVDAVFAYGVPAGETSRRLWIGLVGSPENLWVTAEQVFGEPAEELRVGSPLFFDEERQRLFVLGDLLDEQNVTTARNTLSAFDFHSGQWELLGTIDALGGASGYSVTYDPLRRQVYLFGGELGGSTLDRLLVMDLDTLATRALWRGTAAGEGWGRSGHGAGFDPIDRTLYIYGGERNGAARSDALAFRVVGRTWTQLWTGAEGGPGPLMQPMVQYDLRTRKLWVASSWSGGSAPGRLAPWELDLERGQWHIRPSLGGRDPGDGSRESSFSEDVPPRFDILIDGSAPLWGYGGKVEVLAVDEGPGGASLELLGEYQGAWARAPYSASLGDLVLAPTRKGFEIYRAVALP